MQTPPSPPAPSQMLEAAIRDSTLRRLTRRFWFIFAAENKPGKTSTCVEAACLANTGGISLSGVTSRAAVARNTASSRRWLSREETGEGLFPSTSLRPHRAASRQSPVGCSRLLSPRFRRLGSSARRRPNRGPTKTHIHRHGVETPVTQRTLNTSKQKRCRPSSPR